jgi:hypothetical protein
MKKKKSIALLLSLCLIFGALATGSFASAENGGEDSGLVIDKTATDNGDGTYTIELEAFATGSTIITEVTQDVPTDIVLVLDQSGSMNYPIGEVTFTAYSNNQSTNGLHYDRRHNGGTANLWYPLGDGGYAAVSVLRQQFVEYTQLPPNTTRNRDYYDYRNILYEYDAVAGEYKKVNLSRTSFNGTYTYEFSDGTTASISGRNTVPYQQSQDFRNHAPLYYGTVNDSLTEYTYTYTDSEGNVHTIGTSTGANTVFTTTLYQRTVDPDAGGTRLAALKTAVGNFANAVAAKAAGEDNTLGTGDDVNHRIAVVGFASRSSYGNNTELLSISGTNSGSVGVAYNNITNQNLIDVLQDMDTAAGQAMVTNAVNALAAEGATQTDLGVDMAERIFNANPVPSGEQRNRVVIVFTDGAPTSYNGFEKNVALDAIAKSGNIKGAGATVYSIGVFSGADPTSPGTEPPGDISQNNLSPIYCNWFMQNLSSNNGTPRAPSYYLAASDAATLNSIFQQISQNIEEGSTACTLDNLAVVKDIIAPAFTLPEGTTAADITLETWKYNGPSYDAPGAWTKNPDAMGATASVNESDISVTGFNFSENYAGEIIDNGVPTGEYTGNKLVIKFDVTPRDGFLGGNGVSTNTSAGIYKDANAVNPVLLFPEPEVDVEIPEIQITVPSEEKNIYLLHDIPAADIHSGVEVEVGTVWFDLSKPNENWGLEPWQNEYVDVSVTYKIGENEIPPEGLLGITEDISYSVTVTVKPKYVGTYPGAGLTQTGDVSFNVFKPELKFKDGSVFYGANAPDNTAYAASLTSTLWKHGDTLSTDVTMVGTAPELAMTYTPEAGKIVGGKVNTKQDIEVDAAVKIGETDVSEHTTFVHTACSPPCAWTEPAVAGSPAFLLHVNTCSLTVTKTGGAADESYVFKILKDGALYSELSIWGNGSETLYELPVGSYTIEEDTDWSWRYFADNGSAAVLTADSPAGGITCSNTKGNDFWLNGFSQIVRNIFGVGN